jgi:hypothetical protein
MSKVILRAFLDRVKKERTTTMKQRRGGTENMGTILPWPLQHMSVE